MSPKPLQFALSSLAAAALAVASTSNALAVSLADLAAGGSIISGDKEFFDFHNITQTGDLNVALADINVVPIIGGPSIPESEFGIRFQSAQWTLAGPGLQYDLGIDFHVRQVAGRAIIHDNTLEISGGFVGDGRAQVSEGVLDHATSATLANKYVYFDAQGENLTDHHTFPASTVPPGGYTELEISKDFQMSTGAASDSRVFVSHFDQTFSQIPDGGSSAALAFVALGSVLGVFRVRRQNA